MTDPEIKKLGDAWDYDYQDEYSFGADVVYSIPTIDHAIWPKINQGMNTKSKSACTIFGAWAQLIRLFGLELTREKANEIGLLIVDYCVKNGGYKIGEGRSTPTAVKYTTKRRNEIGCNEFKKEKVFYLRLLWDNPIVNEALDKGHMVGYSKSIQWNGDQIKGYVYKEAEKYKQALGHRLNLKGPDYIQVATGGAIKGNAKWGSQDNYFEQVGTNFYIEDLGKYINKGVYSYVYVILPESSMGNNSAEEEKKKIAETKATNALIGVMTTTWADIPEKYQKMSADYAAELRKDYKGARPIYEDQEHKAMQSTVDMLSYSYKYANPKFQSKFAELAAELRKEYGLQ